VKVRRAYHCLLDGIIKFRFVIHSMQILVLIFVFCSLYLFIYTILMMLKVVCTNYKLL